MNIIFYDIEASDQWAPYCELQLVGYQYGLDGKPKCIKWNNNKNISSDEVDLLRTRLGSEDWLKVSFNGVNYDDMVLARHGLPVNPINSHDVYLMIKTVSPTLPAYGLKFLNWYFYKDIHQLEGQLKFNKQKGLATNLDLEEYNLYDVFQ